MTNKQWGIAVGGIISANVLVFLQALMAGYVVFWASMIYLIVASGKDA